MSTGAGRSVTRRWAPRALAIGWLAVLALVLGAPPAAAHATLISTDPAEGEVLEKTPDVVTFTYDEPVSLTDDSIQVFDAAGEPVDSSASSEDDIVTADLPDELPTGTYVVAWRVVSTDGHPISGSLTFSIGAPSENVVPPDVAPGTAAGAKADLGIAQGLGYAGLLVAAGLVVFCAWMVGDVRLAPETLARLRRTQWWAAGVAVGAAALGVPLAGAYQQGLGMEGLTDSAAYDLTLVGDDVLVLALQAVGLFAALLLRDRRVLATAAAAVALWSPSLVGHTKAFDPVSLLVVTDALHLSAGAIWLGGLIGLALTLPTIRGRRRDAVAVVARFSTVAAGVLALLAASGTLMGWRIIGSWDGLFGTTYGRLLLVKVGIALAVVAIAAWNRWRLLPQVSGAVGHEQGVSAAGLVRRTVIAEACLLFAVIGVTGFLVNQPPREQPDAAAPAAGRVASAVVGDLRVLATMTPGERGSNTVTVQIQDQAGDPVDTFAAPEISVASAEVDLGIVPGVPVGAGTYAAGVTIPAPGEWRVQVSLRATEFDNPVVTLSFNVE
ncbi:MAG TPA: copper resistance protein CopC [Nocardioides sp.]|nr:copper resistance protein CopC [Nocardioides sp.]